MRIQKDAEKQRKREEERKGGREGQNTKRKIGIG